MRLGLVVFVVGMASGMAMAQPTVTITRVQQRYPWNGMVDIDYTISDYEAGSDPNDYQIRLTLSAEVGGSPVERRMESFLTFAVCDLPTEAGANRVTWDAAADGFDGLVKNAKVKASLLYEQLTPATAAYAIVDVSGGRTASAYPVRYLGDSSIESSVFNRDLYKTTRIVLKKVPAGEFWMGEGSTARTANFGNVEERDGVSRHYVKLTHDFLLGVFPVTLAQYTNVVTLAEQMQSQDVPTTPVTRLWWYETQDLSALPFFSALLAKAKCRGEAVAGFTLPTESQWEYACRAGTLTTYYNGQNYNPNEQYASSGLAFRDMLREYFATGYCDWKGANDWKDEIPKEGLRSAMGLWATGQFPANPWGFYDMIGNGFEWCCDWYAAYPSGTEASPSENPTGPATQPGGAGRCFRGTATDDHAWNHIGSGVRSPETTKTSSNSWRHGFRLALAVPAAE